MANQKNCKPKIDFHSLKENHSDITSHIFHSLMPFKVREILLVSSLYDAFIIEEEGLISELVIEEYRHLLLSSPPHVTRVSSGEEAISQLKKNDYDLVITMSKNIGMDPFEFGKTTKNISEDLPIVLLATDLADLNTVQHKNKEGIDKIFFWNGDPNLFLSIIKLVEDQINASYDTENGNVQIIIMVEDSIRYHSMLLPILYTELVQQTHRSLSEDFNEIQRLLRRRVRPKILLAETYEEGMELYKKFKDNLLGIISDVTYPRKGIIDSNAGHEFIKYIKKESPFLPTMLQSTHIGNKKKAEALGAYYLDKNSPTILKDFHHFLMEHLGFGDFVFLLPKKTGVHSQEEGINDAIVHKKTKEIARVSTMKEFEEALKRVPLESIKLHANRNDFSKWLMARGEFKLAMLLRPRKVSDFTSLKKMQEHLSKVFKETRKERQYNVITEISQQKFEFEGSFTRLQGSLLGGKGRGIAFMRSLLSRYNLQRKFKDINIIIPNTIVIGAEEFDNFIQKNNLSYLLKEKKYSDKQIAEIFLKAKISLSLKKQLKQILKKFTQPLAIRSSSLLEDSQNFPFAGIYATYMIPNNHERIDERLEQLFSAIKLVYASVFYRDARAYIEATSSKIEEEKMAIVIQEVIGQEYNGRFYPTFSGVAQSYNFYPVGRQKYEEGIVSVAVGLGGMVVGGEQVLRFSPRFPKNILEFSSPELIAENTQRELYVLNTEKKNIELNYDQNKTLDKKNINDIKDDGSLDLLVSSYDINDGIIRDGLSDNGPNYVTFAGILKYDVFPLAQIVRKILDIGQRGMNSPVEIEFAVTIDPDNKNPPTFAVLQMRPLVLSQERFLVEWDEEKIAKEDILINSINALGNGLINDVQDIIYVMPDKFDSAKTLEITAEIDKLNNKLNDRTYILIGPGRWGTQDRWLGMPVKWSQISHVKVLVETAMEGFNIKPSQGTHFLQNIISRGIGYITLSLNTSKGFIDWEWLEKQNAESELNYIRHIKLDKPLTVKLDGISSKALILKP